MSEYFEQTFRTSDTDEILLNSSVEFEGCYDIGTWVKFTAEHITVTAKDLHALADFIKEHVPAPTVLDTAKFIRAQDSSGTARTLAKFDGLWHDEHGDSHTANWVDKNYDFIEEIA